MDIETARIIVLTGGGNRCAVQPRWLTKFCKLMGIPTTDLYKYVTAIGGTSGGAMNACALGAGLDMEAQSQFYAEKAKRIFTIRTAAELATFSHDANTDSNKPNAAQKLAILGNNTTLYSSPYPDSNYGHNILYSAIEQAFGSMTMQDLKTNILMPVIDSTHQRYAIFSNYHDSTYIGQNAMVSDAVKAVTAATSYLPAYSFGGCTYKDGGIYDNCPVQKTIDLVKLIKPTAKRICILLISTGEGAYGFQDASTVNDGQHMFLDIIHDLDMSMYASKESTIQSLKMHQFQLNDLYRNNVYVYIFHPKLDVANYDTEMDSSTQAFNDYMASLVDQDFVDNAVDISTFIGKWIL